jgi:Zn-dependent protease
MEQIPQLLLFLVPFLFSLCFHEFAHGYVAKMKGDNTAEMMGRLTMNPVAHVDVVGTLIFPSLAFLLQWPLFGWAKPVPVNTRNLKNYRSDMFWIASAGPLSNVALATIGVFVSAILIVHGQSWTLPDAVAPMLTLFVRLNLMLAVFNLIPLHPLDGGKILARFLPAKANQWLEENTMIFSVILMVAAFSGTLAILSYPIKLLEKLMFAGALAVLG